MYSMAIPETSSSLSVAGPRSRSQWLFLEKHCHSFIYGSIVIKFPTNAEYDNILNNFDFEGSRA